MYKNYESKSGHCSYKYSKNLQHYNENVIGLTETHRVSALHKQGRLLR